jgi:electron transport complex protein RnfB
MSVPSLTDQIDAWLPQTQCTRCGYPRCRDYADAIVDGRADINRCPPGGDTTLQGLSTLLSVPIKPLDPECGAQEPRVRAVIDESLCIGCRKCIDVCPVDAIVGTRKLMHTVISHECNGCGLCVPPCPVDCIPLVPAADVGDERWPEYSEQDVARWRVRTESRLARLARRNAKRETERAQKSAHEAEQSSMRDEIRASVERVRARRAQITPRK